MAQSVWNVGIFLNTFSNVRAFNQISQSAIRADSSIAGLGARTRLATSAVRGLGLAFDAVGIASAATFAIGVKGAANLQDSMNQLSITIGKPTAQLEKFHQAAVKMSLKTAQSVADSMAMIRQMANLGIPEKALVPLSGPMSLFADTQFLGRHSTPFQDSTAAAVRIAHDMGLYTAPELTGALTTLAKMSQASGHSVPEALGQIKQFAPKFHQAGVAPDDIINLYALLDRVGYGAGRGGTGLNMLMKNIVSPRGKSKIAALMGMGVEGAGGLSPFVDEASGNVDFIGFLNYVAKWREQMKLGSKGALANRMISRGFDTNAANILDVIGTTRGMHLFQGIRTQEAGMPSLVGMQAILMDSLNKQTKLLTSNFMTLATELAKPYIPAFTKAMASLANTVGKWADYFATHQDQAKVVGGVMGAYGTIWAAQFIAKSGNFLRGIVTLGQHGVKPSVWMSHRVGVAGGAVAAAEVAGGGGLFGLLARVMGTGGLGGATRDIGAAFGLLGERGALGLLGGAIARLGLRAIPVVGNVLLVADALWYLMQHGKDVGRVLHTSFTWMMTQIPGVVHAGTPAVLGAFKGLIGEMLGVLNPMNWYKLGHDIRAGWDNPNNPDPVVPVIPHGGTWGRSRPSVGFASGGRTMGSGLAFLHPNEVVVRAPIVASMDRFFGRGARGQGCGGGPSQIIIKVDASYHAPSGADDAESRRAARFHADTVAAKVAERFAEVARRQPHIGRTRRPGRTFAGRILGGCGMSLRASAAELLGIHAAHGLRTNPQLFTVFVGHVKTWWPADGAVEVFIPHVSDIDTHLLKMPLMTPWGSAGYGMQAGPEEGAQVLVFVGQAEGDVMFALGFTYNSGGDASPQCPAGEFWITDKRGQSFKVTAANGGTVAIVAAAEFSVVSPSIDLGALGLDNMKNAVELQQHVQKAIEDLRAQVQAAFNALCPTLQVGSGVPPPTVGDVTVTGSTTVRASA